jgi:hypothetical protein
LIEELTYSENWYMPVMVEEADYEAGDVFTLTVTYDWIGRMSRDYTISVYSSQDLEVLDEEGEGNMIHMDGNTPSGFTKSEYTS